MLQACRSVLDLQPGSLASVLSILLPYPPSANLLWRAVPRRGVLLSEVGRLYRSYAIIAACGAIGRPVPVEADEPVAPHWPADTRLAVRLDAFPPDRRARRDLDNIPKAVGDALSHAGVWADDSVIDALLVVRRPSLRSPGLNGVVVATMVASRGVVPWAAALADPPSTPLPWQLSALAALRPEKKSKKSPGKPLRPTR